MTHMIFFSIYLLCCISYIGISLDLAWLEEYNGLGSNMWLAYWHEKILRLWIHFLGIQRWKLVYIEGFSEEFRC